MKNRMLLYTILALILFTLCLAGCIKDQPESEEVYDAKPVIYLYPEEETEVTVDLDYDGELTAVYPDCDEDKRLRDTSDETSVGDTTSAKPVIYLYPKEETEVTVDLDYDGKLTTTYPHTDAHWRVTARPDGTLLDGRGMAYNYLYWEGVTEREYDFSTGFVVKGDDTAAFLEEALEKLGLTRREANEFIVYWLPRMEPNPYNLIAFQGDDYTKGAVLTVEPQPETVLRVFMAWKALDAPVEVEPQELTFTSRQGFTLVEWGGAEVQ